MELKKTDFSSSTICLKQDEMEKPIISVIGNGNYGKALAIRFAEVGMNVVIGSRDPSRRKFLPPHANLVSYQTAANTGDIVFICIPAQAYYKVIPDLRDKLVGKTVVDVSNPLDDSSPCGAMMLSRLLPSSHIVKALNTVPAWALENDAFGGSKETYICGNSREHREIVAQLVCDLGFTPVDKGKIDMAEKIEKFSLKLFDEWRCPVIITFVITLLCTGYYFVSIFGAYKSGLKGVKKLALYYSNRVICWVALWLFSLCYLPGCLAGFIQIYRGTKYRPFPGWMDVWMRSRKQLGLIALLVVSMHACLSLIALAGEQIKHMTVFVGIPGTNIKLFHDLTWNAQPSLLFATISFTAFCVLGITSLPTVNARMSWKEWNFIQSKIGYFGLFFATAHLLIYAYPVFNPAFFKYWRWYMPPAVFLQPFLPVLVFILKFILMLPGISSYLWLIRSGWERSNGKGEYSALHV